MDAGSIKPRQVGFSPAIGRSLLARLSSKWILSAWAGWRRRPGNIASVRSDSHRLLRRGPHSGKLAA